MCLQCPVLRHCHGYALYSLFSEAEAFFTDTQEATKPKGTFLLEQLLRSSLSNHRNRSVFTEAIVSELPAV